MNDADCVQFLQQTLPRLQLRWQGFRKVRHPVCKRLARRWRALGLSGFNAYAAYLRKQPAEWWVLDGLARVSISRFYRDEGVFRRLQQEILPGLAGGEADRMPRPLAVWSAGCAGGEEPYTLLLLWTFALAACYPRVSLQVLASDADVRQLARARKACYGPGSLRALPVVWRDRAFRRSGNRYCLLPEYRRRVVFCCQDLRDSLPAGPFDLVLCRNLVFTYFDTGLQLDFLERLRRVVRPGSVLVVGTHESLPAQATGFEACAPGSGFYRVRP